MIFGDFTTLLEVRHSIGKPASELKQTRNS